MQGKTIYGVYDQDDFLVCVGDIKECSKFLEIKPASFLCRISRQKQAKRKEQHINHRYIAMKLYKEN